jgi:hypothetical protein
MFPTSSLGVTTCPLSLRSMFEPRGPSDLLAGFSVFYLFCGPGDLNPGPGTW